MTQKAEPIQEMAQSGVERENSLPQTYLQIHEAPQETFPQQWRHWGGPGTEELVRRQS